MGILRDVNSCIWIDVNVTNNPRWDVTPQTKYFQFYSNGISYHLNSENTALKVKNGSEIYKNKNVQSSAQ